MTGDVVVESRRAAQPRRPPSRRRGGSPASARPRPRCARTRGGDAPRGCRSATSEFAPRSSRRACIKSDAPHNRVAFSSPPARPMLRSKCAYRPPFGSLSSPRFSSRSPPATEARPFGPTPGRTRTPGLRGPVTYYEHVRPILVANCVGCHNPGGIAPFALETYTEATEVAERMREVTHDRIMPPFLADNSGECNTWSKLPRPHRL